MPADAKKVFPALEAVIVLAAWGDPYDRNKAVAARRELELATKLVEAMEWWDVLNWHHPDPCEEDIHKAEILLHNVTKELLDAIRETKEG